MRARGSAGLGSTAVSVATRSHVTLGQRAPNLGLPFLTPEIARHRRQDSERFAGVCIRPDTDRRSAGCHAVTTPGLSHTGPPLPAAPPGAQGLGPSLPDQCQSLALCLGPAPAPSIPRQRRGPGLGPCSPWVRPGPANASSVPRAAQTGPPPLSPPGSQDSEVSPQDVILLALQEAQPHPLLARALPALTSR